MGLTNFKGTNSISEQGFVECLRDNIISYIDWGFLELGAFFNIRIPSSGAYGGNREKLRAIVDPRYTNGRVWEAYHKNWVWESGLSFASQQPIQISGIYINDTFFPITNTSKPYHIDYPNGRIVFDSAQSLSSVIKVEYSHKWIEVVPANGFPSSKELQQRVYRTDDNTLPVSSGLWNSLADSKIQLPAIVVEMPIMRNYEGYQLGGSQLATSEIVMYVLAEDESSAARISNILTDQKEQSLWIYNTDEIARQNRYSLDYNGSIASGAMTYPQLVASTENGGFRYYDKVQNGMIAISDSEMEGCEKITEGLWYSPVRLTTEAILLKI